MIISNSKQFIFVHVPKCAGTAITDALKDTIEWNDIERCKARGRVGRNGMTRTARMPGSDSGRADE